MNKGSSGNSDPVEVFTVPPPNGRCRPEDVVQPVPEVSNSSIITNRSDVPEVVSAGSWDTSKAKEKETFDDVKNNDPKPGATEAEKSEVEKTADEDKGGMETPHRQND